MSDHNFEAPGPGTWEQDNTHFPRPVTRFLVETMMDPFMRGFKDGTSRYGLLFSHLEPARINGFVYYKANGVDPEDGPEVKRRFEAAAKALESRLWLKDLDLWDTEYKPESIRRNKALQEVRVADLDTEALLAHLDKVHDNAGDMVWRHHKFTIPAIIATGLYLSKALEWTGMDTGRLLAPLKGSSRVSLGAVDELRSLSRALTEAGLTSKDLEGSDAAGIIEGLKERKDAVGEATRSFLDAIGLRLAGGYDITDPCAIERPDMLLSTIRAALDAPHNEAAGAWAEAARTVRDAVPEAYQAEFDRLLDEARRVNRLRDERGIYNDNWGTGIARRAILEAGRRLTKAGRIREPESALEASYDELIAMLKGAPEPSSDELSRRSDKRRNTPRDSAPPYLGPAPVPPPPTDGLPPHCARMMGAFGVVLGEVFGAPLEGAKTPSVLRGRAVSAGSYTGIARRVLAAEECNRLRQGDVLVTSSTSAAFNVVLPLLGAIVTDRGGQLSHAAIIAREYGIPAVVGTQTATHDIPDGARVTVDGTAGTVTMI